MRGFEINYLVLDLFLVYIYITYETFQVDFYLLLFDVFYFIFSFIK